MSEWCTVSKGREGCVWKGEGKGVRAVTMGEGIPYFLE